MRLTPLAIMSLALCSLAACASSGGGGSAPPPAIATHTTQSPTQTAPPAVPAPNTPATAEGAIAFVRAYYAEMNHALATNESETLSGYSKPTCPCRKVLSTIAAHRNKNDHWVSSKRIVDQISAHVLNAVHVEVSVSSHWLETRLVDSDNKTVGFDPGHSAIERIVMDRNGPSWKISSVIGSYKEVR